MEWIANSGETQRAYGRETHQRMGRQALMARLQTEVRQNDQELREFDDSGVKMGDFSAIYETQQIAKNQRWTLQRARQLAESPKTPEAEQFEDIFIQGVNVGNWLGNLTSARHEIEFEAFAQRATLFDDLSHRVDDVVELTFAEPIVGEDGEASLTQVVLGFDVTVSSSRQVIRKKLTKSCNDGTELPFGWTHLSYYENGDERKEIPRLPRYTIGLSSYDIRDIWERSEVNPRYGGKIRRMKPSPRTQFKVLTEIRAQNELFYAMLPDDADEELMLQLEATDKCLHNALTSCAHEMVERGELPKSVRERIEAEREALRQAGARDVTLKDRQVIEEFLLESSQAYFRSEGEERVRRGTMTHDGEDRDDPFVQIVTEARALTEQAHRGELEQYRAPQPRNQAIPEEMR